jgi:anaerobic sulfite reductase subunit C
VAECPEKCIVIKKGAEKPEIDFDQCLKCAKCVHVCPTGTIEAEYTGYRVQLGGKLGRHPRLATELDGIYNEDEVLDIVRQCVAFYTENSTHGERFAQIFQDIGFLKTQK